jgi:branched-chain amino acid aminotransferase
MTLLWINGELAAPENARIDPADRGFLLGDGVFETFLAQNGAPLHADRHFARLREAAAILEIPIPYTETVLHDALCTLAAPHGAAAALRLTLTRGPAPRGVLPPASPSPICLITASPPPPALPPARVIVATITRRNEHSPLSRLKTLNYLDNILARQEATRRGADDALLLNTQGRLAEATAANLFVRLRGDLVTPPVAEGALPGIARALLLHGGQATERALTETDLARADEAFLTNALACRAIDLRPLRRPAGETSTTFFF